MMTQKKWIDNPPLAAGLLGGAGVALCVVGLGMITHTVDCSMGIAPTIAGVVFIMGMVIVGIIQKKQEEK